jgi:hypothetical protein
MDAADSVLSVAGTDPMDESVFGAGMPLDCAGVGAII